MARIGNTPKSQLHSSRSFSVLDQQLDRRDDFEQEAEFVDEGAMTDAAEALRAVEVDAGEPDVTNLDKEKLLHMNIDELRAVAKALDVPDREAITEQQELVAAIQRCL